MVTTSTGEGLAGNAADGSRAPGRLSTVDHVVPVGSGKGGVGKSTVAVNPARLPMSGSAASARE